MYAFEMIYMLFMKKKKQQQNKTYIVHRHIEECTTERGQLTASGL